MYVLFQGQLSKEVSALGEIRAVVSAGAMAMTATCTKAVPKIIG